MLSRDEGIGMTPELYPPAPAGVPADLTAPSGRYKRQTALAVLGVLGFFLLYLGLTGWFALVAYRAFRGYAAHPGRAFLIGVPAVFLFLVLVKGLFARRKISRDSMLEVTADEQPELFAFIARIADDTGAPRPHKVYLSADVNAAVFLDVGLINLIVPSRKNLILGLGLVNSLSLDELKAVIAHEFGHFAQRSMGVGQWVYIAQGFVRDLLARRDFLDRTIHWISVLDLRVAWVGWVMRLLVWALRAVVDQLFRFVVLLSHALTRQMEFQADLVSVSVAGSDSLVHALHRLQGADRGWGEAANFVVRETQRGRLTEDLFAVQTRFVDRYREVHALPGHGETPQRPSATNGAHRVFAHGIADAPQMWSTHPSNKDREESCKAQYFPSHLDTRSAWLTFREPELVRRRMTAHFIELATRADPDGPPQPPSPVDKVSVSLDESLRTVDEIFGRPALDRRYQGLYTTMSMTRALARDEVLYSEPVQPLDVNSLHFELDALFDEQVGEGVEQYFQLNEELAQLEGLQRGFLQAPGGAILHRGRQLRRKELGGAVAETKRELEEHRRALADRFRLARGIGLRIARELDARRAAGSAGDDESTGLNAPADQSLLADDAAASADATDSTSHNAAPIAIATATTWTAHLEALAHLLQYAEHTAADLSDNVGYFEHVLSIVFADGRVSKSEMQRLEAEGADLAHTIRNIYDARQQVRLPDPVRNRVSKDALCWEELIGTHLHLTAPTAEDFYNDWIGMAASWWSPYRSALDALSVHTLDVLLETEEYLATCLRKGTDPGVAPTAAAVPGFRPFPFGAERERQERLGWWDRFQVAEGFSGGALRFLVAGAILAPAFIAGFMTAQTELVVHNGLQRPVMVSIGDSEFRVGARGQRTVDVESAELAVTTRTMEGEVIESFTTPDLGSMPEPVYNVAGAAVMVRWWSVYGTALERDPAFETQRLFAADVDHLFESPPQSISTRSGRGGGVRSVLDAVDDPVQIYNLPVDASSLAEAHLRWDPPDAPGLGVWIGSLPPEAHNAAARGLHDRVPSPRSFQLWNRYGDREEIGSYCEAAERDFEIALCATDERVEQLARETGDPWLYLRAADVALDQARYEEALALYQRAAPVRASVESSLTTTEARVLRVLGQYEAAARLPTQHSPRYEYLLAIELGRGDDSLWGYTAARAREAGEFYTDALAALEQQDTADMLALAAASQGAPEEWVEAMVADRRPLKEHAAAVSVWAMGWRLDLPELRERAALAYQELAGEADLTSIDLDALRSTPEALVAQEHELRWSALTQAHVRLAALIAWNGEVPAEWRAFAHGALFLAERPAFARER